MVILAAKKQHAFVKKEDLSVRDGGTSLFNLSVIIGPGP